MPYWLGAGLQLATVTTVAMTALACIAGGWVCGYAHRSLLEWVRVRNPLRSVFRVYRELWEDIWYLIETGRFRPGRLAFKRPDDTRLPAGAALL